MAPPRLPRLSSRTGLRRALAAVAWLALAAPAAALTPAPQPSPPTRRSVERYIACYPKVDAVRDRYRDEVAKLKSRHGGELDALHTATVAPGLRRGGFPHEAVAAHRRREEELVTGPASRAVFLPVVRTCGFASVADYAAAGHAIRFHFRDAPGSIRRHRGTLEGMLLPNLE